MQRWPGHAGRWDRAVEAQTIGQGGRGCRGRFRTAFLCRKGSIPGWKPPWSPATAGGNSKRAHGTRLRRGYWRCLVLEMSALLVEETFPVKGERSWKLWSYRRRESLRGPAARGLAAAMLMTNPLSFSLYFLYNLEETTQRRFLRNHSASPDGIQPQGPRKKIPRAVRSLDRANGGI